MQRHRAPARGQDRNSCRKHRNLDCCEAAQCRMMREQSTTRCAKRPASSGEWRGYAYRRRGDIGASALASSASGARLASAGGSRGDKRKVELNLTDRSSPFRAVGPVAMSALPPNSGHVPNSCCVKPVALPPGLERFSTTPCLTGSMVCANTMGMLVVACCSSPIETPDVANRTSGALAASSLA